MKIGFIGAGKAGFSLGKYFKEKGLSLSGYYSVPEGDAKEAARFTNSDFFSSVSDLIFFSEIIFVTTPDGKIREAWEKVKNFDLSNKIICHTSGALTSGIFDLKDRDDCRYSGFPTGADDVISGIFPQNDMGEKEEISNRKNDRERVTADSYSPDYLYKETDSRTDESLPKDNYSTVSLHPLIAFSSRERSWKDVEKAVFTLEGKGPGVEIIKEMMEGIGNKVNKISSDKKPLYHLGSVMASNAVVAVFDMATECLIKCGFDENMAKEAIKPLFLANAYSLAERGAIDSLTGPCERADVETVKKHMKTLQGEDKELYKEISKRLVKIAEKKNEKRDYKELKQFLEEI